jgi:hypothetical protein
MQSTTSLIIPKDPFQRLVKQIAHKLHPELRCVIQANLHCISCMKRRRGKFLNTDSRAQRCWHSMSQQRRTSSASSKMSTSALCMRSE